MTSPESQKNSLSIPNGTSLPQSAEPRPISTDAASAATPVSGSITSRLQADSTPESPGGPVLTPQPATRPHPVPRKVRGTQREISVRKWWRTTKQRFFGNSQKSMVDTRQKKTVVLGVCLVIVFIAVLLFVLGSGPSHVNAAKSEDPQTTDGPRITGNTETWTLPEPYSTSLRNPTKIGVSTSVAGTQSENTLRVQGIVYSSKRPSAIIANQVVFEGDSIEGVRIIKIEKDSVEFEKDAKRWKQQVKE